MPTAGSVRLAGSLWQAEEVWIVKATVGHRTMSVTKPDRWLVPLSAAASGKSIGDKHVEAVM